MTLLAVNPPQYSFRMTSWGQTDHPSRQYATHRHRHFQPSERHVEGSQNLHLKLKGQLFLDQMVAKIAALNELKQQHGY
ncbi:hypothetical protein WP50_32025, partial [Lactiplantibacillus plantarum]